MYKRQDYFLKAKADGKVKVAITDGAGKEVKTLEGPGSVGMNRVTWDMTGAQGRPVTPGEYGVTIQAGERKLVQEVRVLPSGHR